MNNNPVKSFNILSFADVSTVSDVWQNEAYDVFFLQVEGSASIFQILVEGRNLPGGEWKSLAVRKATETFSYPDITEAGIYEVDISSVAELRVRLVSVEGGYIFVRGSFYEASDGTKIPGSSKFEAFSVFPMLFVKGVADIIYTDPVTGNILGFDDSGTEGSVDIQSVIQKIEGGFCNKLIGVLPDTARISGTYTTKVFSLENRALLTGSAKTYSASVPYCEEIIAESETLTISKDAVPMEGADKIVCYIRKEGSTNSLGTAYPIDGHTVQDFTPEIGETYVVLYHINSISAQRVAIPTRANPQIMTVQLRYGVYSRNCMKNSQAPRVGWLYFIIPMAIMTGIPSTAIRQNDAAETSYGWTALSDRKNEPNFKCKGMGGNIGYYLYVPCQPETLGVQDIAVLGSGLTVEVGKMAAIPMKFVLVDGSLAQPDFTMLGYMVDDPSVVGVMSAGYIRGIAPGNTVVHLYYSRDDGTPLTAECNVNVIGTRRVASKATHITIL